MVGRAVFRHLEVRLMHPATVRMILVAAAAVARKLARLRELARLRVSRV